MPLFSTTANIMADANEADKITMTCRFLHIKVKQLPTEKTSFIAYKLIGGKKDLFTFFHQAGRNLKSVIVY